MTDNHLAVGAILRRGSDVLLVSEESEGELLWALPGGSVAPGETVGEAVRRRVAEEAGLARVHTGRMLWLARYAVARERFETLVFEVHEASPYNSKGLNRASVKPPAAWIPHEEAVARLGQMWFSPLRDPAVAYLTGRAPAATLWSWSRVDGPPETVPALASAAAGEVVAPRGERDEDRQEQH
jgi:8-oxo-dGTP diphosphatase